jgi:hypothetical protein
MAASVQPDWLTRTLASQSLGGLEPEIVDEAAKDPDRIRSIESAATGRTDTEVFHLQYLVIGLDNKERRPEYLALARSMYRADPEQYGYTLAALLGHRPFDEAEVELLKIAFDPRANASSQGWRGSRSLAATLLVQRLAFDVRVLPRPVPAGAPGFTVDTNDRWAECHQRALAVGYGQGNRDATIAAAEQCLADEKRAPGNDHDAEDCRTVISRIKELGGGSGRQP